jgi:4-oxalocrotonate tautomerase
MPALLFWSFLMPLVQITMLQGRTTDQKRKIAKRITDALVEEAGARREGIVVTFHEVSKESYASGGELMVDKVK